MGMMQRLANAAADRNNGVVSAYNNSLALRKSDVLTFEGPTNVLVGFRWSFAENKEVQNAGLVGNVYLDWLCCR